MDQGVTRRGGDTIMRVVLLCTAMLIAALLFVSMANASTLYVDRSAPGPTHDGLSWATAFLKIGDAITATPPDGGVDIWIAAATYSESVAITRPSIALYGGFPVGGGAWESRDAAVNVTIISGSSAGPVIAINGSGDYRVDGLTVTKGAPGIQHTAGNMVVASCKITGNDANRRNLMAAGIVCGSGTITIEDNEITHNVNHNSRDSAGAIYCSGHPTLVIRDNSIRDNSVVGGSGSDSSQGGGISVVSDTQSAIGSCLIEGNTVSRNRASYAGGIRAGSSAKLPVVIRANTVSDNVGGGIYGATSVEDCVVSGNLGPGIMYGGGVRRNIVEDNQGTGIESGFPTDPVEDNIVQRNVGHSGGGICGGACRRNTVIGNTADIGGGIYAIGDVEDNVIENNQATKGGGVYVYYQSAVLNNDIEGNQATQGGGVMIDSDATATIDNNMIRNNTAVQDGGILVFNGADVAITNNVIDGNAANQVGAIGCSSRSAAIQNNIVTWNTATETSGAIVCTEAIAFVNNNTIAYNTCPGGAIVQVSQFGRTYLYNNVVAWNSGGIVFPEVIYDPYMMCDHNCVYENSGPGYVNVEPGAHDVDVDPLFVDPENGDFHLTPQSPCIDAGANPWMAGVRFSFTNLLQDFEGDPRFWNAHGGSEAIVDIGADEYCTGTEITSAPPGWFGPGWVWFSIPDLPPTYDPSALLGFDCTNRLFGWDDVTKNTLLYPGDFTGLELGKGYTMWIDVGHAYAPSYEGTPVTPGYSVTLYQGWNWVGMPSNHAPAALRDAVVRYGDSTATVLDDLHGANWVNWNWVWWDPIDRTAKIVNGIGLGDDSVIHPWYGYRVWVNVDEVTITFPTE